MTARHHTAPAFLAIYAEPQNMLPFASFTRTYISSAQPSETIDALETHAPAMPSSEMDQRSRYLLTFRRFGKYDFRIGLTSKLFDVSNDASEIVWLLLFNSLSPPFPLVYYLGEATPQGDNSIIHGRYYVSAYATWIYFIPNAVALFVSLVGIFVGLTFGYSFLHTYFHLRLVENKGLLQIFSLFAVLAAYALYSLLCYFDDLVLMISDTIGISLSHLDAKPTELSVNS